MKRRAQRKALKDLRELLELKDKVDEMSIQLEELSGVNWLLKGELEMIYSILRGEGYELNGDEPA